MSAKPADIHPCDFHGPCLRHQEMEVRLAVTEERAKNHTDAINDMHQSLIKLGENVNIMNETLTSIRAEISGLKGKVLGFMAAGAVFTAVVSFVAQYMIPILNHTK